MITLQIILTIIFYIQCAATEHLWENSFKYTYPTKLYLYDREHRYTKVHLDSVDTVLTLPNRKWSELETKIYIHEHKSSHQADFSQQIKDLFLEKISCNVILVDWSILAGYGRGYCYANFIRVARTLANFLEYMAYDKLVQMDLNKVHIIGKGMGGHIAGLTGKVVQFPQVKAITALDADLESLRPTNDKWINLSKYDATYVEAIHTALWTFRLFQGHADFFVNRGLKQPGCSMYLYNIESCSTDRAFILYRDSLKVSPSPFIAHRCVDDDVYNATACQNGTVRMGGIDFEPSYGKFHLTTTAEWPWT